MSRKLDWIGAYNRPRTLGPIMSSTNSEERSASASLKHCDKELKMLRADNTKLRKEYDELNAVLKQLTQETSHEKFDERRVNLLKLQIIQLEKQVCILNEALGNRHETMLEVENTMAWLADKLRSFITADIKGPMVPIARADLMTFVEGSESARLKLFKTIEGSEKESVGKDLLFLNPFLNGKHKNGENATVLDISLNKMEYLNIRHVAQLESKLCILYKDLIRVFEQMGSAARDPACFKQEKKPEFSRLKTAILKACITLKDAADDLLSLSLLCPSSPWPALKRPVTKQVPVDRVKLALPTGLPMQKQEEIQRILESSIGVCNHRYLLMEKEKAVLKEELNFYRATHDLHMQYSDSLFGAVRKGYEEFENSAQELVVEPIRNILGAYRELKDSATEQAFRDFLAIMKENEQQLSHVEEMFQKQDLEKEDTGGPAFSRFASDFFSKLEDLVGQCQKQRDQAILSRKDVAEEQTRKDLELQQLIEDLEAKYEKQWCPVKTYSKAPEKEAMLHIDKTEDVVPANVSGREETKLSIISCKSRSARDQKKNPVDLFSEIDGKSHSPEASSFIKHASDQANSCMENAESPQRGKKLTKKKKWEPHQEWISDFSGLTENSDISSSETTVRGLELQTEQHEKLNDISSFSSVAPDSSDKSNHDHIRTLSCDSGHSSEKTTKFTSINSKKSSHTYKPRLYTANRTLKLRRAESLSGLNPPDECNDDKEIGNKTALTTVKKNSQLVKPQPKSGHSQKPCL
ncbi:hypothetical protein ElyMa_003737600 [Elysia marginata]|uniref:Uncharacterized protein n=1 Tax=Elysia marginata TaxID=1093978 RepID=A0AAV4F610_9GAST|nr:hypothetical protein ElyMa_003737600 [Elysia marginata]